MAPNPTREKEQRRRIRLRNKGGLTLRASGVRIRRDIGDESADVDIATTDSLLSVDHLRPHVPPHVPVAHRHPLVHLQPHYPEGQARQMPRAHVAPCCQKGEAQVRVEDVQAGVVCFRAAPRPRWRDHSTHNRRHWIKQVWLTKKKFEIPRTQMPDHINPDHHLRSMIGYHLAWENSLIGMVIMQFDKTGNRKRKYRYGEKTKSRWSSKNQGSARCSIRTSGLSSRRRSLAAIGSVRFSAHYTLDLTDNLSDR